MRLQDVVQRGTRASQPAATTVAVGVLYYVTDEFVLERGNGTTWDNMRDGSPWTLIATQTCAGAANYNFTGLAQYSGIKVLLNAVTLSSSGEARLRVSIDNGANYLLASGDYLSISGSGAPANITAARFYDTAATAARYGAMTIDGFNVATAPKAIHSNFYATDTIGLQWIPNTAALNALQVIATAGNLSGGTIYVLGQH